MVLFWLKQYPTTSFLSALFDVSQTTVSMELNTLWRLMWTEYAPEVQWPEREEWQTMREEWPELPGAVGVIDGTSHRIYRPQPNIQMQFYSGHRHVHCLHTQIVIDNNNKIRHISSGFLGHNNDAQCFNLMENIGPNEELDFPSGDCYLLADKIYPSRAPLLKPFSVQQIARAPDDVKRRKMRKLNRKMCARRVYVEHVIGRLKNYCVISSMYTYRNSRLCLSSIVELCAGLSVRSVELM
jgi:hypothetical protein